MSNGESAPGDGHPITLNGVVYPKGFGTNAYSDIQFALGGGYSTFTSDIGVDDEEGTLGTVNFQVWTDGVLRYDSGVMTNGSATKTVSISVTGVNFLNLTVTDGGDGNWYDHADWAGARLGSASASSGISSPTPTRTAALVPTATPIASGSSPSGVPMPVGDLPGWHQIFADDFTQDAAVGQFAQIYGSRWSPYPDGWSNTAGYSAMSRYYPSKVVSASNGMMQLNLHSEYLTSAQLNINGGYGSPGVYALDAAMQPAQNGAPINQLYGKYSVRFRTDSLPGFYSAWLLWPQSENWPYDGEIDFPEGGIDSSMCAFLHHEYATSPGDQDAFCTSTLWSSGWHTATTEWGPTQTKFILDGVVIGTSTTNIPSTPMRYVLQNEACWGSCPSSSLSGYIQVDWFVMYAPAP